MNAYISSLLLVMSTLLAVSCSLLGKSFSLFDLVYVTMVQLHIRCARLVRRASSHRNLAQKLTVVRLTVASLMPASWIDDQSLPRGLAVPRSPRGWGIAPHIRLSVVKVLQPCQPSSRLCSEFRLNGSHVLLINSFSSPHGRIKPNIVKQGKRSHWITTA
jgi:hypothetical protein